MNKLLAYILLLFSLSLYWGCSKSVSDSKPFSEYVGREIEIKNTVDLHEVLEDWHGNPYTNMREQDGSLSDYVLAGYLVNNPDKIIKDKFGQDRHLIHIGKAEKIKYYLRNIDRRPNPKSGNGYAGEIVGSLTRHYWEIKKGNAVTIQAVLVKITDGGRYFIAQGTIYHPENNQKVKFEYLWGDAQTIYRAPWEDESIPEKRKVDY